MSKYDELLQELKDRYLPENQIEVALEQMAEDIEGMPLSFDDLLALLVAKIEGTDLGNNDTDFLGCEHTDPLDDVDPGERPLFVFEILLGTYWVYVTRGTNYLYFYLSRTEPEGEES